MKNHLKVVWKYALFLYSAAVALRIAQAVFELGVVNDALLACVGFGAVSVAVGTGAAGWFLYENGMKKTAIYYYTLFFVLHLSFWLERLNQSFIFSASP